MPRARKDLDPGIFHVRTISDLKLTHTSSLEVFEHDETSEKVRCTVCYEANPSKARWLVRGSVKQHLDSEDHARHLEQNQEQRQLDTEALRRQQVAYSSNYVVLDPTFPNPVPPPQPRISGFEEPNEFIHQSMDLQEPIIPAYIEPIIDDPDVERERLRRQVELLMLQAEQRDEFGDELFEDDATVTNTAEFFGAYQFVPDGKY
jgi:hypothetical protein